LRAVTVLLFSNTPSKAAAPESPVETVIFGISIVVPTYNVQTNASMLVFRASTSMADGL